MGGRVRLTTVGCSGSYPGPDSPASCYLVEAPFEGRTYRVLLDLGNGALGALQRVVDPLHIDAALLSHLHPDHCIDFTAYYVLRRYHPDGPFARLPVWGPDAAAERLAQAYGLDSEPGMTGEFDFRPYPKHPFAVGPFTVEVSRVEHPVTAYALRLSAGGRSLVYSGDTAPCSSLVDLANGADLLLAESAFLEGEDNPPGIHLTGREAAEAATKAGVGRLLLTHVPPWYDAADVLADARPAYSGDLEVTVAGATYDV